MITYVPGTIIDFETDRRAYIEWSLDTYRTQIQNTSDPINKCHAEMMINSLEAELKTLNETGG